MEVRGQYGVLTSFFLIVVIIGLMIFLAYFNSLRIAQPNYIVNEYSTNLQSVDADFNSIQSCLGVLNSTTLSNDQSTPSCVPSGLRGYNLNTFDLYGCSVENYTVGNFSNCQTKLSYLTNFIENGQTCLAKMVLCK